MQYPGYVVSVVGHIGKTKTKIFIDVGVGDAVKPTEITMQLLATEKAPLFEKDIELWAYPIESIFAEKFETSVARGNQNSRMKDYHDLLSLIRANALDVELLRTAISETFSNRKTVLRRISFNRSEYETIQKYWTLYRRNLSDETLNQFSDDFKIVIDEINQFMAIGKLDF